MEKLRGDVFCRQEHPFWYVAPAQLVPIAEALLPYTDRPLAYVIEAPDTKMSEQEVKGMLAPMEYPLSWVAPPHAMLP